MKLPKAEISRERALELWNKEHSEYAKEQLVLSNTGMIGIVMKSLNLSVTDDDLFATGIVGLIKAINSFDQTKGYMFSTYATRIIRNEILMTFRKKRADIALSLDDTCNLNNGDSVSYADIIADDKSFEDSVECAVDLQQIFKSLPEREQKIFYLTYEKQMTQCEIAKVLGVSQAQISRIMRGMRKRYET